MSSFPDVASLYRDDAAFRALAQRDPRAALQRVGIAVPAGVTVDFLSSAFHAVDHLLDAARPACVTGELDDALLDGVAGGTQGQAASSADIEDLLARLSAAMRNTDPTRRQ